MTPETLCSTIDIDMILEFNKISNKFVNELDYLRPFGIENPRPKFMTRDVEIINSKQYGRDNEHLKLRVRKKNKFFNAIGWNLGYFKNTIDKNQNLKYDIIYNLQRNDLKTSNEILLIIEDIKLEL